jgi:uncharacterized OB-fold protein
MAYLPEALPLPNTDERETSEFWQGCQCRELAIQCCSNCGTFRHPPVPLCHACHSFDYHWHKVSGKGSVYSYTICHHPAHPALKDHPPYNVVAVELSDAGNVRLIGNILDVPIDAVQVGMPVELVWEERGGVLLPQWKRAG